MKRAFLLVPFLAFGLAGCAARVDYYRGYAPPPPRYEVVGVAPGPGYIWINGYWAGNPGHYRWVRGRWSREHYRDHDRDRDWRRDDRH